MGSTYNAVTDQLITFERFTPLEGGGDSYTDLVMVYGADSEQDAITSLEIGGFGPSLACYCEYDCCGHWFMSAWGIEKVRAGYLLTRTSSRNV